MAHKKYITLEEIVEALNTGKLKRRSVSQMIQYYKRKGDLQSAEMYKEALDRTKVHSIIEHSKPYTARLTEEFYCL